MSESDIKKLLGLRIKQLRKRHKLTQFALGEKTNIDQRQIAYIEGGNCFPTLKTLNKFTKVFNCTIKELFDYEHFTESKNIKEKIIFELSDIDDKSLKILYDILRTIKNNL